MCQRWKRGAGSAQDGVDERILWLGRPPSKIGIFADQFEEHMAEKLEALSRLKDVEHILRALQMSLKLLMIKSVSASGRRSSRSAHLGGALANGRSQALSSQ